MQELKTPKTSEELRRVLKDVETLPLQRCLEALKEEGIIRTYNGKVEERFARQVSFIDELTSSWDETLRLQKKLRDSTVSVFGIGGIGTWITNGLYQIGIGKLRITDPDYVEESNLNRQLFFDSKDIGRLKVGAIAEKLPDADITTFTKRVSDDEDLTELVKGADFLVNCADKPSVHETTRILDQYARRWNVPYCVAGGYNMHLGMVGPIVVPGVTASFEDFLKHQRSRARIPKTHK